MAEPKSIIIPGTEEQIRLPPQNIEAEQSVLGSLLLDKDAIIKVGDILTPQDFYRSDHSAIYEAMLTLFEKRAPIDILTLSEELEKRGKLDEIGGASYLTTLVNSTPSAVHISSYAQIIQEKAILRRLIAASSQITEMGYSEPEEVDAILDKAERTIFSVSQKFFRRYFTPIKEVLAESFDRIDELSRQKGKLRGLPTGFRDLDNLLAGLQPSNLIVVAARPAMGKSAWSLNVAEHIAVVEKLPVGIFSLEMSKEQIVDRLLCSVAGIDSWRLRTGNLTDEDFPRIGYAMGVLAEAPIFIDDSPILNAMEIRTKARRLLAEHNLSLIIVDYLQLMEGRRTRIDLNRVQEISEISRALKALARELNIPVIAISQLSRAVESRHPQIPQLADLRESGAIEQEADVVLFIYREDYYKRDTERKNIADILIRKHRHGPTGDIELYFQPEQMKFRSIEKKR